MKLLKRFFMFVAVGAISLVALIGCQFSTNEKPLSIDMERVMYLGEEYELKVNVLSGSASEVEWSIDNNEVVEFVDGKIVPIAEGSFNLTATLGEDKDIRHIIVRNRYVYVIDYVLNNGVEDTNNPLVVEYVEGAGEIALTQPVREGYVFKGFYDNAELEGEVVTSIKEVKENLTFYAAWEIIEYPIAFELNGGSVSVQLPTERNIEDVAYTLPQATMHGHDFVGWFEDPEFTGEPVVLLNHENLDITNLYACFVPTKYDITYDLAGATSNPNPSQYAFGEVVELVAAEKAGYSFKGWTYEGNPIEKIEGMMGEITLVATWEVISYPISFELNGGLVSATLPTARTIEDAAFVLPQAELANYDFVGWYANADFSGEAVTELNAQNLEITCLYAKFTGKVYNVTYDLAGGENSSSNPVKYTYNEAVVLDAPVREHYEFVEWQLNGVAVKEIAAGTSGDVTLVAVWKLTQYTVKFNYNDGTDYVETVQSIDDFAKELVDLFNATGKSDAVTTTRENFKSTSHPNIKYVFNNAETLAKYKWFLEFALEEMVNEATRQGALSEDAFKNTKEMLEKMIAGDTTAIGGAYADGRTGFRCWIEGLINSKLPSGSGVYDHFLVDYSIAENQERFFAAQGEQMPSSKLTVEDTLPVASRPGYVFLGWFENGTKVESISGDCTLVAEWKEEVYKVQFDAQGGSIEGLTLADFTTALIELFNSTGKSDAVTTLKETFKATSHPNIKYVFNNTETLDEYRWFLEFALEEMTNAATANAATGEDAFINTKEMLEKMIAGDTAAVGGSYADGRTALRWWIEGLINETKRTGTGLYDKYMVDYAVAENMARFMEAYYAACGVFELTINDQLPKAEKEGYIFQGWFLDGQKVEHATGNQTLVAEWEIIKFEISYDLVGGAWAEGQEGVVEFEYNQEVTLPTPVKEGYTFLGWTQLSKYVTEIENADYELVAKWKSNTQTGYEVIFDLNGGTWEYSFEAFVTDLLYDFNNTGKSDAVVTTREDFCGTTHPNVKYVFNNSENLAKYQWLLEFALQEITIAVTNNGATSSSYYTEVKEMLEKMIAGDTTAIGGSYANGRTILRYWLEGLINKKLPTGRATYDKLVIDYSKASNFARFDAVFGPVERTIEPGQALPTAIKEDHFFLGWFLDGEKVEYATGDDVLVAQWIHVDDYEWTVEFDLNGGSFAGVTIDTFAKEIVDLFNSTGASDALTTTRENFKGTTHPNIKYVFNKAENLATYKWFLEFALEEMTNEATLQGVTSEAAFINTKEMLEKMIAGDTAAVGGSYADGRTALRWWIEGLINSTKRTGTGLYDKFMVDYSNAENMARFIAEYTAASQDLTFTAKETLPTPIKDGNLFLGWAHDGEIITKVRGNWTLVAQWLDLATVRYTISYDLNGGEWAEGETPTVEFGWNEEVQLLNPVREGYNFLGWYEDKTQVSAITNKDYVLVAKWEEIIEEGETKVLYVNPEDPECYDSIEAALEAANTGDTIVVCAGAWGGVEITKGVTLAGPNAGVNPNDAERLPEASFNADVIISADNVTIDGIKLIGKGRIIGNAATGAKNLVVKNVYSYASTLNPTSSDSYTAPIHLHTVEAGVYFENVELINLRYEGASGRPMAFYGAQIVNLKVVSCHFSSNGGTYNDAVKIDSSDNETGNKAEFGIKGNVLFQGNLFENYTQYVIWAISYAEGSYKIVNNTFKNCGQTPASHCAARFASYVGEENGLVNIDFSYNTVDNAFSLIRFDKSENRTATNQIVTVHYNKLLNCIATYFVNNANGYNIDATNNWYDETPTADKFLNATWSPYIEKLEDLPEFVDLENSVLINYELNGGQLPEDAAQYYNKITGLSQLPVPTYENHVFLGWYYEGKLVTGLEAGIQGAIKLTAQWREDALYVGAGEEEYLYATIAEALAAAKAGDKIILLPGTYNEALTISVANLTIAGPNAGLNNAKATRGQEAVITGAITLATSATGLTIDGVAFTGAAKITGTQVEDFTFINNKVYDTNAPAGAWAESNAYKAGFIYISSSNTTLSQNLQFHYNVFENVADDNLNISYVTNVTFDGNVFHNFGYDAIRFNNGYIGGLLSFTNNEFVQDSMGGYNGIYFRIYGGAAGVGCRIIIDNNKFENIGTSSAGLYSGAISARNYQEKGLDLDITDNVFDGCLNYIRFRNNATAPNHAANAWDVMVANNEFYGVPAANYFAVWNASDTNATENPILAKFGANYYEDNNGAVITDLAAYESYFKQVADKGTAMASKPTFEAAKPLHFYSISYDLAGGTTYDSFTTKYNSFNSAVIALPTLTKPNHNFLGWSYNGTVVTELPADASGNLHLVAQWQLLEGEFYDVTFVTDKGSFPTRDAASREEIIAELYADLYEWATDNEYTTKSREEYYAYIDAQLKSYEGFNLRNTDLGNYPAEDGSTEYFFNVPKYYAKWKEFFAIFHEAMLAVNSGQSFYTDDYATFVRLYQFVSWSSTGKSYFNGYLSKMFKAVQIEKEIMTQYQGGQIAELPLLTHDKGLAFLGWYDNPEYNGTPITHIYSTDTGDKTFYAKWEPEIIPETITVEHPTSLKRYETYQLVWSMTPDNITDPSVEFFSSNPEVATVTSLKGLITAMSNGTTTITVKVYANRTIDYSFELTVYSPGHFVASYETNSYVGINESIKLNAEYEDYADAELAYVWTSSDSNIANVDENGNVFGIAQGTATIRCALASDASVYFEFPVTVLASEISAALQLVLDSHESNVFTDWDLGIGAGIPTYYMDIFGSVNKILFNHDLTIDDSLKDREVSGATGDYFDAMTSIEFITVHYTGNMSSGADSEANAKYFIGDNAVSIHYTTGNDGIFQCLPHELGAWHAGDSGALDQVGTFQWIATGVQAQATDPLYPVFTISDDFYYEINGAKTSVPMPRPWDYDSRGTDHILNADGTISSQSDFGQSGFQNRTPESFINDQSLPFTIIDGEYYMGTTWWCYTQVYEGRICSTGGNRNSIGIESCVNQGSDLWLTWQMTAQLVASLMEELGLDITRVRGHHFFSGKDCPQPMLENDLCIWWKFLELVEAEYELLTKFKDATITCVSNDKDFVDDNGRVINTPDMSRAVSYTVTVTNNGNTETVTLYSIIPGAYERD
ncbi:MAG: InlB B-repeat-containing protein [Bacilli bacterium]|nr:InlB B-repeat-containing protein [Bacilli bacterium]